MMMASPTMDPTQRKLMMFLPLLFVLFVINFPAGVLVYWITTNTWTMCQQFIIKRRIGPVTPVGGSVIPAAAGAGAVATSGKRPTPSAKDGAKAGATGSVKNATKADGNGGSNGSGSGGLSGLLRGRSKSNTDAETVATQAPSGPPPRPPRKKKKRSGRRR
jgi:YidC/Oxa1 family membrane protein insertase